MAMMVRFVEGSSAAPSKRRRHAQYVDPMEVESANKTKLLAAAGRQKFCREIRVLETGLSSSPPTVTDDYPDDDFFYEFTAEDYNRILATKKRDDFLKTKVLKAQEAARRSKFTQAVVRVRFPDNLQTPLEVSFHPSETIQSLVDCVKRVVARPELPFCLYTTPPKKIIEDMSQDFYSAGFVPGAIVYFSNDLPRAAATAACSGPCLREDTMYLKGLQVIAEQQPQHAPDTASTPVKPLKPKWLKM